MREARVAAWAFVLLLMAGCARSEESVRAEFDAFVAASRSCATADECAVVSPGCPLGCQVAVRADKKDAVSAKAKSLIEQYEVGGRSCDYDCIGLTQVVCEAGQCGFASEPSTPGGGAGGTGGGG
jgi:hypothetical protein